MPTVVICDDEPDVRMLCRTAFELEGWDVVEAGNGRDCIDVVRALRALPDCVVMDIMMPVMDGLNALVALREEHGLDHLPVLLLTAKAGSIDIERGLRAGAAAYLTKPFSPLGLVAKAAAAVAAVASGAVA